MSNFPRVHRPCADCPFRRDVEPGQFPTCRYHALRDTLAGHLNAPVFACHKTPEGGERACAGWLATQGADHLGVRLAVVAGRLPVEALSPRPDWPPLFEDYSEMAQTQGRAAGPDEAAEVTW